MARLSDGILPTGLSLRLTVDRYQEIMRLPEAAFNGLYSRDDESCELCNTVWTQRDRDGMALAIATAEEMREDELGYHLAPIYIGNEVHEYSSPMILDKKHLISIGVQTVVDIEDDVTITLSSDPVVVNVTTDVSTSEIIVCYPDEDVEIRPSRIVDVGDGTVNIYIPRSRLLDPDVDTNCDPAPRYDSDANFILSVDIKRRYMDTTQGVSYVWTSMQECGSEIPGEVTQLAYARVDNARLAIVRTHSATLTDGAYYKQSPTKCYLPERVLVSYLSGRRLSTRTEMETARLAHTLLPGILPDRVDLCMGCWTKDMEQDKSELYTPYGNTIGAVSAWLADSRAKVGQGGKFPKVRRDIIR